LLIQLNKICLYFGAGAGFFFRLIPYPTKNSKTKLMLLLLHFILGVTISFFGSLAPSMLNMTATKISLNNGKQQAIKYAIGVSNIVLIQVYVAIMFTRFLRENPLFVQSLQKVALVIFALLSVYFYIQFKKEHKNLKNIDQLSSTRNSFAVGMLLSSLNMFSIPFYCGVTTALDLAGWLQFSQTYIITFVIGSAIGTFLLLLMYLNYAEKIQSKSKGLSKNLNLILSLLTGVLALITLVKVW
jgi:threonine/homoserine/homoserine lactone efflux protein